VTISTDAADPARARPWRDTREWIERASAIGQLRVVRGVSWQSEIGQITAMLDHADDSPSVVFDDIPGYRAGRRVIQPGARHLRAVQVEQQLKAAGRS
jgi:hypothetical protein